jgi:hypothetical protein
LGWEEKTGWEIGTRDAIEEERIFAGVLYICVYAYVAYVELWIPNS